MTPGKLLYLSCQDVESLRLEMRAVLEAVEAAFVQKGRGQVQMPPKTDIHPRPDAFLHAMPAYLSAQDAAGLKWIAGYPANQDRGLPYISGLLILNDAATGFPLAVMDATWITAMRTGAATALAAKYLARPDARTLAILGCGVQGRANTLALRTVFPGLERVVAYDVRPEAAAAFARECQTESGFACEICATPEQAVRPADLVVTSGPILRHPTPVIEPAWLRDGVFVCPLDFDSYVSPQAFAAADLLCTDDLGQYRYFRQAGYFAHVRPDPADLGDVIAAGAPRRTANDQRIISLNLGLALEDVAVGRLLYERALAAGAGTWLDL